MTVQKGNTAPSAGRYQAMMMLSADERTDLAELHGNDSVDLQTQGQRQRRTGCLLPPLPPTADLHPGQVLAGLPES